MEGVMRHFETLEIHEALAWAAAGNVALHTHRIIVDPRRAPQCFVRAVDRGEDIAHLFDLDTERLKATARKLGVRVIYVDRAGTKDQHIDLCGTPLKRALAMCSE